jgi:hypothetical protein
MVRFPEFIHGSGRKSALTITPASAHKISMGIAPLFDLTNEAIVVFGRKFEVLPGQLFRKLDNTKYVFEVLSVREDSIGAVHVQMRRRDEPSTRRTLALSVLMDPDQFELVE